MKRIAIVAILMLACASAVPALASARDQWSGYNITSARAKQYAIAVAQHRYAANGVTVNRSTVGAKPQGAQFQWDRDYGTQRFHRWVVRWAGHDGKNARVFGFFLIVGQTNGFGYMPLYGGLRWA
jgi:hypothetical protein